MLELVFFSTNRTKIAHFRFLGQQYGLEVKSFRETNYYASYHEPKIDDRAELLRQSYISALNQWRRRTSARDENVSTFFFEDTSVCIECLSKEKEIPGVNVKYWMQGMTFKKLDRLLKTNGNNRIVTVRSDIVMHLPSKWKILLGIEDDFLWVHGETIGHVSDIEQDISPNLVYPWLDNKTFNRWFVPLGASLPMSALSIEDAQKGDFRAKAFEQIVQSLRKLKLLEQIEENAPPNQLELPQLAQIPSVLIICGPSCAGKTTTAGWITTQYGIPHIEASDFMYKAFWERHGLRSTVRIGDFAEDALKSIPDIVAGPICKYIFEKKYTSAVVTGFRAPEEVKIFCELLAPTLKADVLFLNASEELRFERAKIRAREAIITLEKFNSRDKQEERMGLREIVNLTNTTYLENNGTTLELNKRIEEKYHGALKLGSKAMSSIKASLGLESYILMTLLDSNIWMTTTEIAFTLNNKFRLGKSKNNVSRYFNQEFHPFYEVRLRGSNEKKTNALEYMLSPTGISQARILLQTYERSVQQQMTPQKNNKGQQGLF